MKDKLMIETMIHGANSFAIWLSKKYDLPITGIDDNIKEWREQLE